jgi:hypothetical protein
MLQVYMPELWGVVFLIASYIVMHLAFHAWDRFRRWRKRRRILRSLKALPSRLKGIQGSGSRGPR